MGCLLIMLAVVVSRLMMIFILLLTGWFGMVFKSSVWPVLGFIFMSYATPAQMAAVLNTGGSISPGWLVVFIMAVLADIGHWGGGYRVRVIRRED